ncbi:urease accessory UreF family protein, partial [Streptomyces triticirhizae]
GRDRPGGAHQPVVLGAVGRVAGLGPRDVALAAGYDAISAPASAVVRLLGLDPFEATAVLARLAPETERVADRAVAAADGWPERGETALPAGAAPLLEIAAEDHAAWPVRLFAS